MTETSFSDKLICIVGPQHSGKSSLGRAVAQALVMPHVDLDERVLFLASKVHDTVSSVRELFKVVGKGMFQYWEHLAFDELRAPLVLSSGGGIVDNQKVWAVLTEHIVIALYIDPVLAWNRLGLGEAHTADSTQLPAYLHGLEKPFDEFVSLTSKRNKAYRASSALALDGATDTDVLCKEVITYLHSASP